MQPLGVRFTAGTGRLRGLLRFGGAGRSSESGELTPRATLVTVSPGAAPRPDPELRADVGEGAPGGDFSPMAVPNPMLRPDVVPPAGSPWERIEEFALTYDGYAYWSDVAELGNRGLTRWTRDRSLPDTLDELRGCLFYEQRRWHHFGEEPDGRSAEYVRALLDAIRQQVAPPGLAAPLEAGSVVHAFADDGACAAWLAGNSAGFVVAVPRAGAPAGGRLHLATCSSARPSGAARPTASASRKVGSTDRSALVGWCAATHGREPEPCRRCRP